jgi:hypothetical protein
MSSPAGILLFALAGGGYWFSGRSEVAEVEWNVEQPAAAATIAWRLDCAGAVLASGRMLLPAKERAAKIAIALPAVRVASEAQFFYRAEQPGGKVIAEGRRAVHLYPTDLLAGMAERTKGKQLYVWDRPEGLPAVLKAAGLQCTAVRGEADLQFVRPDMILVGAEQLGEGVEGQGKLKSLAGAGASVLVLRQTRPATLAGYAVARRVPPAKLEWLAEHPLARCLRLFEPWTTGRDAWAVRLPADEPAQEIAWWPREAPGDQPAPLDALVLVKAVGKGRLVLCQLPLGPWESDPRSQLFLADALDYLASPAVPTLPPSRRPKPQQPLPAPKVPRIDFSR